MRKATWRVPTFGLLLVLLLSAACTPAPPTGSPAPSAPGQSQPAGSNTAEDPMARWNQTLQAAKTEGKVVVVTHTNLYYREQIARFQEKFPEIQVEHVAIRPSEFTPKVVTEQQNGVFGYDVWISPTSNMVETVVPAGGFQRLAPFLMLPEVTNPASWRGGKHIYGTSNDEVFIFRPNVTGGVWVNRQVLSPSEFNSIDQLLDPRFRGRIVMRTPDAPHNTSLTLTGILHGKGEDFVRRLLTEQQPAFIDNARLVTQNLINGRYAIALGTDNETLDACKREGGCGHLEEVRGYEYVLGQGVGVLKNAPHPNAAAVFVNWFLSREGQQTWVDTVAATIPPPKSDAHSARADVEPHPDAVSQGSVPDYANLDKYSLQGMEQGGPQMQTVLNLYRQAQSGTR